MSSKNFRPPSDLKRQILDRLVNVDFVGQRELAQQLSEVSVRLIDENGSLEIRGREDAPPAPVDYRIPVEAQTEDSDGMTVILTLHVVNGRVSELEVIRADSKRVLGRLNPTTFTVVTLP